MSLEINSFKKMYFIFNYVAESVPVCVSAGALGGVQRGLKPSGVEVTDSCESPRWVLGTQLESQ